MKTLDQKPKKTILATAHVSSLGFDGLPDGRLSKVSSSGTNMVTQFKLILNGPAQGEARNGVNAYFTWNPAWFRSTFDPVALALQVDKLEADAATGDEEAIQQYNELNRILFAASANYAADPGKDISTMRGLVGGRSMEEHRELWSQLDAALSAVGEANPECEDDNEERAAQDRIVDGVDRVFKEFFGPDGPGGKHCCFTYGHKNERQLDADGNQVYVTDKDGKDVPSWVPSKYRNILKWVLPNAKSLKSWRKSCESRGNIAFMIDEADPFGDGSMAG